jgi:hypothetical protein
MIAVWASSGVVSREKDGQLEDALGSIGDENIQFQASTIRQQKS